jgi:parvulin-like peptidyl-prolyl isomerase
MKRDLGERELRKTLMRSYQRSEDLTDAVHERLLIGKLMREVAHKEIKVTDAEVKKAWEKIPAKDKKVAKLVRAQQIVVQTEEEATEIHTLLRRGHDFGKLAAKRSISPEGKRGGDLGWFEQGIMPKVFDDSCFSLKLGQTSPITPSEYGFHIFRVTGLEPERSLDFEALKDRIRSKVLHKKLQAAEDEFVSKLRNEFEILRHESIILGIN